MSRTQAEPGKYAEPMSITVTRDEEERGWDLRQGGGVQTATLANLLPLAR